ncbi:putative F-box protein At5g55150 [Lathyrus oleraceus]|uniref:putative F-box protein At5g55150 n=1 Tax=Pisum sativum TaxID=3888 RepID=UPI0021D25C8A|nr:putative F-box protein At5g55150 [Pisum sativum]XP_050876953.1 putative F-box protein At5g55150 [Pisum sativum]
MLMIPTKKRWERSLYGISSNTSYNKRLCGSSHGWLAKVDYCSKVTSITLLNPFKDAVSITSPPIYMIYGYRRRKDYEYVVHKIVLSANPTFKPRDYVVVAIYSVWRFLAILRAGQKNWTYIDDIHRLINDVIFYKGLVYAMRLIN